VTTDVSSEVVKCPNCKEDVPKTLYCLNCGYPLYKQEKLVEEEPSKDEAKVLKGEDATPEPLVEEVKEPEPVEPEVPDVEEKAPEPMVEEVKAIEPEEPDDVVMQAEEDKITEPEPTVSEPPTAEKVEKVKTKTEAAKVEELAVPTETAKVKEPTVIEPEAPSEPEIKVEEPVKIEPLTSKVIEPVINETPPEVKVKESSVEASTPPEPKTEEPAIIEPVSTAEPARVEPEAVKTVEPITPEQPTVKVEEEIAKEPAVPEVAKVIETIEAKSEVVVEEKTVEPVTEPTLIESSKETVISAEDTSLSAGSAGLSAEVSKMLDSYEENTITPAYVPDSLTKDLMESIAKNLTLKIRLVNILREGKMKEETFDRLYRGYVEEGQIWISRREEIIKKLIIEIDEMEETYANSVEALELLEVKRGIGETLEDEYLAKMPGYRWDVDHLDFEIGKKKNRLAYLEAINSVLPNDIIIELKELASTQYNTIESLEVTNEEIIAYIKSSLYDAIKILG
jgi:hypothetical protein